MPTRSLSDEVRITDDGLAFLKAIIDAQAWDEEVVETFLEKPHKWDDEFSLWLATGRPTDAGTPEFERWAGLIDAP